MEARRRRRADAGCGDDAAASHRAIFTGLGSLSYGELAGERMKLGLLLHDPEEEHDCFSDNTYNSHFYDVVGIRNVYLGSYKRIDGTQSRAPSVSDLVKAKSPEADAPYAKSSTRPSPPSTKLKQRGETVEAYDQMIGEDNEEGNAVVQAGIDALLEQTKAIERAVATLDLKAIEFEGSKSLDDPKHRRRADKGLKRERNTVIVRRIALARCRHCWSAIARGGRRCTPWRPA